MVSEFQISKKAIILQEAALLFRERGFGKASMRDIAERVGMEAASMYNHISSKDAILEDICEEVANAYITDLNAIEASNTTYTHKLESVIASHIKVVSQNPEGVSVVNHDWKYLSEPKRKAFFIKRRAYEARIEAIIKAGISNGEFKNINSRIACLTLLSSMRWIEFSTKAMPDTSFQEIEHQISQIILAGIRK
jgi:AcrR family transcriptional regulator